MKQALQKSKDTAKSLQLLDAAITGDLYKVKTLVEKDGAEAGIDKKDIGHHRMALLDIVTMEGIRMGRLHDDDKILNVPMYWAAFNGHDSVVHYFLMRGLYCQESLNASLYGAVRSDSEKLVQALLDAGADATSNDHIALEQSLFKKNNPITDILVDAGKDYTFALAAFIRAGNFKRALSMLDHDIDIKPAFADIARQTTDRAMLTGDSDAADYLAFLETLFGYAEARGTHIHGLLALCVKHADDHWSSEVIMHVASHPSFDDHPYREQLLAAMIERIGMLSNPHYDLCRQDHIEKAEILLKKGAPAQAFLTSVAKGQNVEAAQLAMDYGADPRIGDIPPVMDAERRAVQSQYHPTSGDFAKLLTAAAKNMTEQDAAAFDAATVTAEWLRTPEPVSGRTGLMTAAMGGRLPQALKELHAKEESITIADLTVCDQNGMNVLQYLRARSATADLFDKNIWKNRPAAYHALTSGLPPDVLDANALQHKTNLQMLASAESQQKINAALPQRKDRFKIK